MPPQHSALPVAKGPSDGIKDIKSWFQQFPKFVYQQDQEVTYQFLRLLHFLSTHPDSKKSRKYSRTLAYVLSDCRIPSEQWSGYGSFADKFFSRFPKFDWDPSQLIVAEYERLIARPEWLGWKKSAKKLKRPQKQLHKAVESAMNKTLQNTRSRLVQESSTPKKLRKFLLATNTSPTEPSPTANSRPSSTKLISSKQSYITNSSTVQRVDSVVVRGVTGQDPAPRGEQAADFFGKFPNFKVDPTADLVAEFDRLALTCHWAPNSTKYEEKRVECFTAAFEDDYDAIAANDYDSSSSISASSDGASLDSLARIEDLRRKRRNVHEGDSEEGGGAAVSDSIRPAAVTSTNYTKLAQWQTLCRELSIEPVPNSITQCRLQLKKVHVNLVDLVVARQQATTSLNGSPTPVGIKQFPSAGALARYIRQTGKYFSKKRAKQDGALRALLVQVHGP